MSTVCDDQARLITAGWRKLRSGKWTHQCLQVQAGRRRPFSEAQALTLLSAEDPAPESVPCPDCGAYECPNAQHPTSGSVNA